MSRQSTKVQRIVRFKTKVAFGCIEEQTETESKETTSQIKETTAKRLELQSVFTEILLGVSE